MEKVNERFGRKITAVIGAIVGLVGCLWLRYGCAPGDPYVQYHIFFVAILLGKLFFPNLHTFLIFPNLLVKLYWSDNFIFICKICLIFKNRKKFSLLPKARSK